MRRFLILFVLAFLVACAAENREELTADGPSCETSDMSYDADIKSIVTNNCASVGCHNGPNGVGGLDLSTYEDVERIASNGQLIGRMRGTRGNIMPPQGMLPDCTISKVESWVNDGAANN